DPKEFSRELCNKQNLATAVEKVYGSPQKELRTPPIFGFIEVGLFTVGGKQWFASGWPDIVPKYKDLETGVEKSYMVLNCGTDDDCNTGNCIKPTSDPVDNFCEDDSFSGGDQYTEFYLPDKEPLKGTDNVLPAGGKEICRFVRPIANGSRIEEAELREIIVTGFDRDSERNKTIEAKVYSDNNGKPGSLLGKVNKDIEAGSIRKEILKLPEPVRIEENAIWVCLKYPYSISEGYLSPFSEGGFDMFVYTPDRNDVNRFETERSYIKVMIEGVVDKKTYGDTIREFALPIDDFVYDSTTDNTLFRGKDLCKPMETTEKAYVTEITGAGFDKGDWRKQPLKAVVR
ncbi:MAG TPA: hypothetical protein VJB06_04765, partial [archaeon]|nr:hypothetical protein [archaeon]